MRAGATLAYCPNFGDHLSALHLGLLALDVRPGDEIITVAFTFAATVEAILYCGARPVYVDVDPNTLVMDAAQKVLSLPLFPGMGDEAVDYVVEHLRNLIDT